MECVYKFSGRHHPFSNFYPATVTFEGITFANSESAFQAAKSLDVTVRKRFADLDPSAAKRMGRRVALRSDWESVKYSVMLDVLRSKFQTSTLKDYLLATGTQEIVEDTTGWHDNVWGDCCCPKCDHIKGGNLLGKALMELRAELGGTDGR